jgi:hypothetical protein
MNIIQILKEHVDLVNRGGYRPTAEGCINCGVCIDFLQVHEAVPRGVRFLDKDMIYCVQITVLRWACRACKKTFRHLPPFLRPYMRYSTPTILEISKRLLNSHKHITYEELVTASPPNQKKVSYENGKGTRIVPSTPWCWIVWMAGLLNNYFSFKPQVATDKSITQSEDDGYIFASTQANTTERFTELYHARKLFLHEIIWPLK